MPSVWRQLLLAGVLSLTLFGPAFALGAAIRMSDPLPEELRERVADLMRSRRPGDADAALAATKIEDGPIWREKRIPLLRVETDCRDDFCMVIIGRVTDRAIIPEVTLRAYPTVLMGHGGGQFWGFFGAPIAFQGRDGSDFWPIGVPTGGSSRPVLRVLRISR